MRASLFATLLVCCLTASALCEVNQQAIDDVAAGKIKEARASWWGFDETDSTASLQAAIDSRVPKLIVDNVGKPWIVDPIRLVSDQEIVFEQGTEVVAKRGSFKGTNDCLFTCRLQKNVTLRGEGAVLRMWRSDYDGAEYQRAEWRHVLSILSSENVKVYGLTLSESGGDGIYLGSGGTLESYLPSTAYDLLAGNADDAVTGIETVADVVAGRGVLLDVGRAFGDEHGELPDGFAITEEHLESTIATPDPASAGSHSMPPIQSIRSPSASTRSTLQWW